MGIKGPENNGMGGRYMLPCRLDKAMENNRQEVWR